MRRGRWVSLARNSEAPHFSSRILPDCGPFLLPLPHVTRKTFEGIRSAIAGFGNSKATTHMKRVILRLAANNMRDSFLKPVAWLVVVFLALSALCLVLFTGDRSRKPSPVRPAPPLEDAVAFVNGQP